MTRKKTTRKPLRLQKLISDAGIASRRRAEELIEAGRVLVNDEIVDSLPAFVDPSSDRVVVDGSPIRIHRPEYFLLHKPKGVVCTNRDSAGRMRAVDLLPPIKARLNIVGRLDADSTGLLLMTNDGDLAEQIAHPRLAVPKIYRVEVQGQVPTDIGEKMRKGVHLAEGRVTASEVEIVHRSRQSSVLRMTLREGRNRQVRRMLARLNHKVKSLKRVQIGPLVLKGLPVGACRRLTTRELTELRKAVASAQAKKQRGKADRRRRKDDAPTATKTKRPPKATRKKANSGPPDRDSGHREEPDRPRRRLIT